jgi:hypothetical protein
MVPDADVLPMKSELAVRGLTRNEVIHPGWPAAGVTDTIYVRSGPRGENLTLPVFRVGT